ncbi:MAG: hypothetical protein Q7S81_00785 [bacterium]|nr:hypothetical protein [bacterium]
MPEKKKYSIEQCLLAIRSDPNSSDGFKDEQVWKIFLDTEIGSEKDIPTLTSELAFWRKNLMDRYCEEISKNR